MWRIYVAGNNKALIHTDRQTGGRDEANRRFSRLCRTHLKDRPIATLFTTNFTWTGPGSNPGLRDDSLSNKILSHKPSELTLNNTFYRPVSQFTVSTVSVADPEVKYGGTVQCRTVYPSAAWLPDQDSPLPYAGQLVNDVRRNNRGSR